MGECKSGGRGSRSRLEPLSWPQRLHMALHSSAVSTSCLLLRWPGPEHLWQAFKQLQHLRLKYRKRATWRGEASADHLVTSQQQGLPEALHVTTTMAARSS